MEYPYGPNASLHKSTVHSNRFISAVLKLDCGVSQPHREVRKVAELCEYERCLFLS